MNKLGATLFLALLFFVPVAVQAQSGIPLFDPEWQLVPDAHELDESCPVGAPLGFGGVLQLVQNGMNAAISLGILICVLVIVFAGFLWILTPTNPESHSQAKKVLTNAVIGFVIILSAWLIVDFVMKLLYDGETTNFGPWNAIIIGGDACVLKTVGMKPITSGGLFDTPGLETTPDGTAPVDPHYTTSGACSPASVRAAAMAGGKNMSVNESKFFACIARPESQCGADLTNYMWGRGSSAYGPFQILLDGNSKYFDNPTCSKAAGVSGNLNCDAGFKNGNPIAGNTTATNCMKAAANLSCSAVAAYGLFKDSGHRAWTGNKDSSSAHMRCIKELSS